MAALTNVRDTSELGGKYIALPVKGATTIYQGSIVAIDANGYAIPGKKATGLKAAGRAEETVENKGGDGEAVIPNGATVLQPGDRTILFIQTQFSKKVMQYFKGRE